MKVLIFLSCLSLSLSFSNTEKWLSISSDRIELSFDYKMTSADLDEIKLKLKEKDISLNYTNLKFNKKGKLISVSFEVDCNDGFSGSASTKIFIPNKKFGFYRDYRKSSESTFGTGNF